MGNYWEERLRSWEDDIGIDRLGADHEGRFATVEWVTRGEPDQRRLEKGYIARETIGERVEPLGLPDPDPLIDRLWAIAGRHLRPVHRLLLGSDPDATRKQLAAIQTKAQKLDEKLIELAPVTAAFLEEFHGSLPADRKRLTQIDLNEFSRTLGDLYTICALASNELIHVPNAPTLVLRRQTLKDAMAAIEEHGGQRVQTRWSRQNENCYEFKGASGMVLRSFMALVEPKASEATLVKLVRSLSAEKAKQPSTP